MDELKRRGQLRVDLCWEVVTHTTRMLDSEEPEALRHAHVGKVGPSHANDGLPTVFDKAVLRLAPGGGAADGYAVLEEETMDRTPQEFKVKIALEEAGGG